MAKKNLLRLFQQESTKKLMKRLVADFMGPYWGTLFVSVICMLIAAASTAVLAYKMESVINTAFEGISKSLIFVISAQVMAVFIVKGIAAYSASISMTKVGEGIVADMRKLMVKRVIMSDLSFFHSTTRGEIISRFTSDVGMLHQLISSLSTRAVKDLFSLIGLLFVMVSKDWFLSLVIFVFFPMIYYPVLKIGKRMRHSSLNAQQQLANFASQISEIFSGIRIVKACGMEEVEIQKTNAVVDQIYSHVLKVVKHRAATSPIMELFTGFTVVGVILYGGIAVLEGSQTKGSFFAFITAVLLAYEPLKRLVYFNGELQEKLASAERVFQMLDIQPKIVDSADAKIITSAQGNLRFNNVSFAYSKHKPTLKDISFSVISGQTVALVGPSGAGKSTIFSLLLRFYEPDDGQILLDGYDINHITMYSLRAQLSLVSQDIVLFNDTVLNNIRYGLLSATDEQVMQAACDAAADEFIQKLPNGYNTTIGEQGVSLSGGQRQRLSIARAMVRNAPILLLDEATSALDTESEKRIQDALGRLVYDRTTLIIAHRLSTVQHADVIIVINDGGVVASGTHDYLLQNCALYDALCRDQLMQ